MGFRLVPNSVTLDDLERRNNPNCRIILPRMTYSERERAKWVHLVAFAAYCIKGMLLNGAPAAPASPWLIRLLQPPSRLRRQPVTILGASEDGVTIFGWNSKRHILGWFHTFWAVYACKSVYGFSCRWAHEKRGTTKSHKGVIFHLFAGNSPLNQLKLASQWGSPTYR